jgi:hypothetical protein
VVDHDGHVLVVPAIGELIDADNGQPVEFVALLPPLANALDDRADGGPGDAHLRRHRRLVATLREVRGLILELTREPRLRDRPGNALNANTAHPAVDAAQVVSEMNLHPDAIEVSPGACLVVVVDAVDLAPAAGAPRDPRGRSNVDEETERVEARREDSNPLQGEQGGE